MTDTKTFTYDEAEREAARRIEDLRSKRAGDVFFNDCTILSDLADDTDTYTEEHINGAVKQFIEWFDEDEKEALEHETEQGK